jgi:tetratricopeptide (TPR) repeat protein
MVEYRYSGYIYRPRRRKKKLFVVIFILLLLGGGAFYSIFFLDFLKIYKKLIDAYRLSFNDYRFLQKNLDSGNYNVVILEGIPYLQNRPYNSQLLRYIGEAYYFISTGLTGTEKIESIDRAIIYLRKGITLSPLNDILTKSYFILGMSYFRKGIHYYGLAASYLGKALEQGYRDDSLPEIMGYCYYRLGAYDEAINYLGRAKAVHEKDVVLLFLAHSYKNKGQYESAREEFQKLVQKSEDDAILEEAYSALAWIDFQEERYDQAIETIAKVFELNESSAEAHYLYGNIYEKKGDLISARKEWRLALKIDPKHIGAIEKLY